MKEETTPTAGLQVDGLPLNNKPVWAWYSTKHVKHIIPCIAQYTEGWDIEVGDEDGDREDLNYSEEKDSTFLPKGWYECCEQSGGTYDEIYIKRDVVKWQAIIEPLTPAPLSEQKQEGETHKDICIRAIKATYPTISNLDKFAERYFVTHMEHSHVDQELTSIIIEQSQNTAKQIDQYKARIEQLEALLKNSRNAIAELNETELQFGIQLCNDIDIALQTEY